MILQLEELNAIYFEYLELLEQTEMIFQMLKTMKMDPIIRYIQMSECLGIQ